MATRGSAKASRPSTPAEPSRARKVVVPMLAVTTLLIVWEVACDTGLVPSFLLPSPLSVVRALMGDSALIASHALTTLAEAALGLGIGVATGFAFALVMDRFSLFYLAFEPLMTISQTIPTVAVAPLLVLWFGYGLAPKVILVVLTTFFPVTVSLVSGFRSVDPDMVDLLRTMGASRWQVFRYAKLPAAADQLFSGLTISATYAIVGAVIAEWLGGSSGLGVYMTRVRKSFSYDRMFASIIVISALSLCLMRLVDLLEYVCLPWKRAERSSNEERHS